MSCYITDTQKSLLDDIRDEIRIIKESIFKLGMNDISDINLGFELGKISMKLTQIAQRMDDICSKILFTKKLNSDQLSEYDTELTYEQEETINHVHRMIILNIELIDKLCSHEKYDIVYGFELGQIYIHISNIQLDLLTIFE